MRAAVCGCMIIIAFTFQMGLILTIWLPTLFWCRLHPIISKYLEFILSAMISWHCLSLKMPHALYWGSFINARDTRGQPWEFFVQLTFLCNAERFVLFTDTESIKFEMFDEFLSTGVWKFLLLWTSVFVIVLFTFKYTRGGHRKIGRVCQHYKHGGISQLYITNML